MAKKKFYAVRKGMQTGIFESWPECQKMILGYHNAEYKSFSTKEEAEQYVGGAKAGFVEPALEEGFELSPEKIIAYVDGSYDHKLKKYSFGCILLMPSGDIIEKSGNGDNPASLAIRNVAGEMLGAMYAVKWSMAIRKLNSDTIMPVLKNGCRENGRQKMNWPKNMRQR